MIRIRAVLDDRTPDVCREADGTVLIACDRIPHNTGDPENPCRCTYQPQDDSLMDEALVQVRRMVWWEDQRDNDQGILHPVFLVLLDLHQRATDMEDVLVKRVAVLEQEIQDLHHKLQSLG